MNEINGIVARTDHAFAHVTTPFGEITIEFDDWRIADNGGLKVGDRVSALGLRKYPELENGRIIFYIGENTSVWVNSAHLPIRPEGS